MNPLEALFGSRPPAKLKVFAPNGDTKEIVAFLGIRGHTQYNQLTELFLQHEDGTCEVLSKKVVVQNLETGEVCYNPRVCPKNLGERVFITGDETMWLQENPHWPAILELWDNPVDGSDHEVDGIN